MDFQPQPRTVAKLQALARAGGAVVAAMGLLILTGYALDVGAIHTPVFGLVPTMPNTAFGLALSGYSLYVIADEHAHRRRRRRGLAAALVAGLLGLATLGEYVFDVNLGLDQALFADPRARGGDYPAGRMAAVTATNFVLVAAAYGLLDRGRALVAGQGCALIVGTVSLLHFVGYSYNAEALYRFQPTVQMAFNTTMAFAVLSAGLLLARPNRGIMAVLCDNSAGGLVARRILPITIVVPLVVGWLRLAGERAGLYGVDLGSMLQSMADVLIFTVAIYWVAVSLHRTDAKRERAEYKFRLAVESAPNAMVMIDRLGAIVMVNSTAERLFGYERTELLAQPVEILVPERFRSPHPGYRANFLVDPEARLMGVGRDLSARRKDGSEFPVEIGLNPIETSEGLFVLSAVVDISERKRAEESLRQAHDELEARVIERTRELVAVNKELEAFSYSISHDLRAPLRAIDEFSRIVLKDFADAMPAAARDHLNDVRSNTLKMGQLIDDLLDFARLSRQSVNLQPVSVARMVGECLEELSAERQDRQVTIQIGDLPVCQADPTLLKQVWVNLLSNALKYTSRRETATIEVGARGGAAGDRTYFVKDNGVGFDMRYMNKLFGVFQRLHRAEEFEGTGVGLAIVQRIIHRHGGSVWAEAQPDQGATFFFTLKNGGPV